MLTEEIKETAISIIRSDTNKIIVCIDHLNEEDLWKDFSQQLVSIGNLILHLIGNISQHTISGLGKISFIRERDREFSDKPGYSKEQLKDKFKSTIDKAIKVIESLNQEALVGKNNIQGKECSGIEDLISVVEHLSYHTGQIIWAVKYSKNVNLDFYKGINLNKQNLGRLTIE